MQIICVYTVSIQSKRIGGTKKIVPVKVNSFNGEGIHYKKIDETMTFINGEKTTNIIIESMFFRKR